MEVYDNGYMTTLETLPKESNIEEQVDAVRKNLRVFNDIQRELIIRRHGNPMDWVDTFSPEYETAYKQLTKELIEENKDLFRQLSEYHDETVEELENRVEQYHLLELRLMKHIDVHGKIPQNFTEWHSEFGKVLMKIIYTHPELYKRYIDTQDESPEAQESVLRDIEDLLYTVEA